MRIVAQRVDSASVSVDDKIAGQINQGLVLLVSAGIDDTNDDAKWMANKVVNLRIFADDSDKMNLSLKDIKGELLVISQFTLHGDCRKGNRPSFIKSMKFETAREYFNHFVGLLKSAGVFKVETGIFGRMMKVKLVNDGPVTMLLDSKKSF